jgi:alpha-beta hydrolase superfamily lysophospholipase
MRSFLRFAAVLTALTAFSGNAQASGHIYLLRGLANVFSTGLDSLGDKLEKLGYSATVHSAGEAASLGLEAARLQKSGKGPIIIIGHSIGANAAISMAETMKDEGASVALIITFGPTFDMLVPSNVSRVINYYQTSGIVTGIGKKGKGFHGSIANINVSSDTDINHFNIEKNARLHAKVIAAVGSIAGRKRSKSADDANKTARSLPSASVPHR